MKRYEHNYGKNPEGVLSTTSGYATETTNFGEAAFGILNKSTRDKSNFTTPEVVSSSTATLFSVGNGSNGIRKNIIELKADGTVLISGVGGYDGTNPEDATGIADKMQGIEDSVGGFEEVIDSINIVKDETNDLVYTLMVDGEERGSINIPKDQFLKSVTYNEDSNELIFTFVTSESDNKEVRINMTDLVDTYTAGDGLNLEGGQFSIKVDADTQSYIEVTANGVKIIGVNEALSNCVTLDGDQTITGNKTFNTDVIATGFAVLEGTSDEVLTADGDSNTLKTINGQTLLGSGDVDMSEFATQGDITGINQTIEGLGDTYAKKTELEDYLPLSGGTLTGNLYIQNDEDADADSYKGITFRKNVSYENGIEIVPSALLGTWGDELLIRSPRQFYLTLQSDGSEAGTGNPYGLRFQGSFGNIIWGDWSTNTTHKGSRIDINGFRIRGKSDTDLLHAAGGTTTLKTINNNSLLGSGNIEVPTIESIQDITGSNTYTGANYISKETNLTDAVVQLDEEIKATNDNLALEYANAEATYAKKTELDGYLPLRGGTMIGQIDTISGIRFGNYDATFLSFNDGKCYLNMDGLTLVGYEHGGVAIREPVISCQTGNSYPTITMGRNGVTISNKTENDLLNASGSTTPISDIVTQVQAAIVDSAPETLDTLNELAAALGDDPNFATTVTNQIAQKADKTVATTSANGLMSSADKTKLDGIDTQNLATKSEVNAKVSGTGVSSIQVVATLPDVQEEGVLYIVTGEEA